MGVLPTDGGDVFLNQLSIARLSADARAREGLGYVPQGRDVFPGLTVQENLQVGMQKLGRAGTAEMEMALKFFPMLVNKLKQKAGTMSGGEQQQLAIARALVGNPRVLLLDEPSEGVQPSIVQTIAEKLLEIARTLNIGILLVEQNMYMVEQTASRCCVMEKGRIVETLTPQQLKDDGLLRRHLAI
jgi:branched-chain amino acid transport system ATP-binding protein